MYDIPEADGVPDEVLSMYNSQARLEGCKVETENYITQLYPGTHINIKKRYKNRYKLWSIHRS